MSIDRRASTGRSVFWFVLSACLVFVLSACETDGRAGQSQATNSFSQRSIDEPPRKGSVVFLHPDGMGVNTWGVVRTATLGPDGRLNWDRMSGTAVYLGHMKNSLTATSHGGATVHAYGVKVVADSYGQDGLEPVRSRAGTDMSIMQEAHAAGITIGIVNSGTITEPGTGVFVASIDERYNHQALVDQIIESGARVILGGGEYYFLPEGVQGVHAVGRRTDGRDMTERARELGYTIVYDRDQLAALPDDAGRVLGLFAPYHTFNDKSEETLAEKGLPLYRPGSPSVDEMTTAALRFLSNDGNQFFLVVEEEGTDNFSNANNAAGTIEAGRRADETIGVVLDFIDQNPETLLLVTSDSDAGGIQIFGSDPGDEALVEGQPTPERARNGSPYDGTSGTASEPFLAPPDRAGNRWLFAISWANNEDMTGGILLRAAGLNSERVYGTVDNTDVYRFMYETLFGKEIE